jgi:hypothetical protein
MSKRVEIDANTERNILEDSYKLVKHFLDFLPWEYTIATFKHFCTP